MVAGLTVLAAALRFATLTHQSLWFDEAQAVHEMRLSLGAMLHTWSANEPNPPLYFVVAWLWTHVFGTGTAGLRSLSAIIGTATVPLVYLAGREMVSRRASLVAAGLIALSPFMIWYSQEAREYGLLAALCAASLIFFARAWRAPGSRRDLVVVDGALGAGAADPVLRAVPHRRRGAAAAVSPARRAASCWRSSRWRSWRPR